MKNEGENALFGANLSGTYSCERTRGAGGGPNFSEGGQNQTRPIAAPRKGDKSGLRNDPRNRAECTAQTAAPRYANRSLCHFGRGARFFPSAILTVLVRTMRPTSFSHSAEGFPVFIAESANLDVSRGKDGKFALRGGGAPRRGRGCLMRQRVLKFTGETPFGRGCVTRRRVQPPIGSPPLRVTRGPLGPGKRGS